MQILKLSNYFTGIIFSSLVFTGCGSSSNSSDTPSPSVMPSSTDAISAESFSLDLSKVSGYRAGDSKEDRFLSVINYIRTLPIKCNDSDGLEGPVGTNLVWNTLLNDAAQEHSDDMLATGLFSHNGSGTNTDITGQSFSPARASTPFERMQYNEYKYVSAGENIASRADYPTLIDNAWAKAFEGWIKSETGHCSNIMNSDFKDFAMAESLGIADLLFNDGVTRKAKVAYWTQNFGKN